MLRRQELCAGELAERCSVSGPAMSRHLRVLRKSGLIETVPAPDADSDARLRVYRLRPEAFQSLKHWADHMQALWSQQLASFREHAERGHSAHKKKGPN